MSVSKRATLPTFPLACALALILTLTVSALPLHNANAQTIRDHRTQPIVRDHRARLCRVGYDAYPDVPGNPYTITTCHLPDNNTQTVGSFCTCSVLVQGHYTTVGGSIVLASAPNG